MEHERNDDIPKQVKWIMTFINRVGFPIVAFGLMWYLCFQTIEKNTKAAYEIKETLLQMNQSLSDVNRALRRRGRVD